MPVGGCLCLGDERKGAQKRRQLCRALKMFRNWPRGHKAEERASQAKAGKCELAMLGSESVPRARVQEKERRKPKVSALCRQQDLVRQIFPHFSLL